MGGKEGKGGVGRGRGTTAGFPICRVIRDGLGEKRTPEERVNRGKGVSHADLGQERSRQKEEAKNERREWPHKFEERQGSQCGWSRVREREAS